MLLKTELPRLPRLSEQDIRARVGNTSFQRGEQYFRSGAIFDTRCQGRTLRARCSGSRAEAYRLHVTFDEETIVDGNCSCPVGAGGHCKHTAALLLTWLERPDEFAVVEEMDAALERRSKEELIALIKQMLRQEPELESLLEVPLPTSGQHAPSVSPETYRRQAAAVFRRTGDEWGAEAEIADGLQAITAIGDGFAEQEDWTNAAAVYEAVAGEVLEQYGMFHDEGGDLAELVDECVQGLGRCLTATEDGAFRERLLHALFNVYRWDIDFGGIDMGAGALDLILEHTSPEERRAVAGWVREAMPQATDWSSNWRREAYGGFLLELELDTLDDEAFLQVCRETSRSGDLVDRLLSLGRVDEAREEAQQVGDYELLGLADIFVEHGRGEVAEQLMAERSQESQDLRLGDWLKRYYRAQGRNAPALELAEQLFRAGPGIDGLARYQELRELAQQVGRWETMHPKLQAFLRQEQQLDLLIQIYLDEGEIDQALKALPARRKRGLVTSFYGSPSLELRVAEAAEQSRPKAALEIYREVAERLIDQRGRGNYQEAARLLEKVRALYQRLGESGAWQDYIADLRDRTRSLRALKEELAAAGL